MKRTVVAMFPRYEDAEQAVHKLRHQGVDRDDISIMALNRGAEAPVETDDSKAAKRAGAGAAVGGLAGAVLGLTSLAIPGIGPFIAAGPIAGALAGVGGGLVAGGLIGAFIGLGLDNDSAKYYADGVQNGGAVVAVHTDEFEVAERLRAMEASDVRTCGEGDKACAQGETVPVHDSGSLARADAADPRGWGGENAKSNTAPGEAVPLYDAESITPPDAGRHQESTGDAQHVEDAYDTRVKTDSGPEHWAPHNAEYQSSFDEYAGVFARADSSVLAERGGTYSGYAAATQFGHEMAHHKNFADREWVRAEDDLRAKWLEQHPDDDWDRVRTYIQQGWVTARGTG